jgi:hypothetical protein
MQRATPPLPRLCWMKSTFCRVPIQLSLLPRQYPAYRCDAVRDGALDTANYGAGRLVLSPERPTSTGHPLHPSTQSLAGRLWQCDVPANRPTASAEPSRRSSSYRPEDAKLSPGLLAVRLLRYRADIELAPTVRGAMLQVTFDDLPGREAGLAIDLPGNNAQASLDRPLPALCIAAPRIRLEVHRRTSGPPTPSSSVRLTIVWFCDSTMLPSQDEPLWHATGRNQTCLCQSVSPLPLSRGNRRCVILRRSCSPTLSTKSRMKQNACGTTISAVPPWRVLLLTNAASSTPQCTVHSCFHEPGMNSARTTSPFTSARSTAGGTWCYVR